MAFSSGSPRRRPLKKTRAAESATTATRASEATATAIGRGRGRVRRQASSWARRWRTTDERIIGCPKLQQSRHGARQGLRPFGRQIGSRTRQWRLDCIGLVHGTRKVHKVHRVHEVHKVNRCTGFRECSSPRFSARRPCGSPHRCSGGSGPGPDDHALRRYIQLNAPGQGHAIEIVERPGLKPGE